MKCLVLLAAAALLLSCETALDAGENYPELDSSPPWDSGSEGGGGAGQEVPAVCGPSDPCPGGYECVQGQCAGPINGCDPDISMMGDDGCGPDAVCYEDADERTRCFLLPACPSEGACAVGVVGATCNEGYILHKNRICLVGACVDASSCPAGWDCLRGPGAPVLGNCSDGSVGTLCYENAHCVSHWCVLAAPGFPGVCL